MPAAQPRGPLTHACEPATAGGARAGPAEMLEPTDPAGSRQQSTVSSAEEEPAGPRRLENGSTHASKSILELLPHWLAQALAGLPGSTRRDRCLLIARNRSAHKSRSRRPAGPRRLENGSTHASHPHCSFIRSLFAASSCSCLDRRFWQSQFPLWQLWLQSLPELSAGMALPRGHGTTGTAGTALPRKFALKFEIPWNFALKFHGMDTQIPRN